jgi:hypothetical protein
MRIRYFEHLGIVVLVGCILALSPATAKGQFLAGAAVKSIQPTKKLPVSGGMGTPKPASEKRGELTARAVVLEVGATRVAIVSLDLLGFPAVLCDRVRAKIDSIPASNIVIGATHTHSAPDVYAFPDGKGGHTADLSYIDFVVDQAAAAIRSAFESRELAHLKIGTDKAKGKIAYNYYAPALYDQRMNVMRASKPSGECIFTLVNYAIHPEVLGSDVGIISPDCIGPLYDKLEADSGGKAIFMNGAQGGMITADNRLLDQPKNSSDAVWNDARTWEECLRIGHLMADEANRIVNATTPQSAPSLKCVSKPVTFPVQSEVLWQVITNSPLGYTFDREQRAVTIPINLIQLGDAQIVTIPGEAMPNIGFYLKRKMTGKHNMLFGLTNEAFGYILTKVDFASFPRYDYVSQVSLGEMTGEILIGSILELIETTR